MKLLAPAFQITGTLALAIAGGMFIAALAQQSGFIQ